MSPKSFFMIVLRIIGLFSLINVLKIFPAGFSQFATITVYDSDAAFAITGLVIFLAVFSMLLLLIVYFLLMKPEKLVKILKLNTGFEEEKFEFNLSKTTILRVSIIVIGGITLLREIPRFVQHLFVFWQEKQIKWVEHPQTKHMIYSTIIIIVSYLLIYYNEKTVKYMEEKTDRKSENKSETPDNSK